MTAASSGIKLPASLPTSSEEISEQFYLAIIQIPKLAPAGPLGPGGLSLGLGLQSMGSGSMQRRGSNCWQEEQNQVVHYTMTQQAGFCVGMHSRTWI